MSFYTKAIASYGFTLDGFDGDAIDQHGRVGHVIFSITYAKRENDVEFTISDGADDWGAKMSSGEIIPLRNPQILFQNRDNSIVQFDMEIPYPSNTPCFLVYMSEEAWFNVKEIATVRPFVPNTITGYFGFTTKGYGGTPAIGHGKVDRVLFTIPFTKRDNEWFTFTLSTVATHWAAYMGNGQLINLRKPELLQINLDSAIVKFTMDETYPSDSPCLLVCRSPDAWFKVKKISA